MQSTEADTITLGALRVRFLVEPEQSGGSVSVFECAVPAGAKVPAPHSHDAFTETIYGLAGSSSWTVDGEAIDIQAGEAVCIRRGAIHGFDNRGEDEARFLAVATPGMFGPSYFREMADVLGAAAGGPPDRAALIDVMRRHGLTPA